MTTTTIRELLDRASSSEVRNSWAWVALADAGTRTVAELQGKPLRSAPGFGSTSLARLASALVDEVLRLQAIVDNVEAALHPKQP